MKCDGDGGGGDASNDGGDDGDCGGIHIVTPPSDCTTLKESIYHKVAIFPHLSINYLVVRCLF